MNLKPSGELGCGLPESLRSRGAGSRAINASLVECEGGATAAHHIRYALKIPSEEVDDVSCRKQRPDV
ncbi:unnamed protein product [Pleuronectes platessa]|uniref:Uncharacterized protein n=1 Tax=Pleuronectes platessa TaxID=8262 RepID=A0A9N7UWD7_PLEPL|nr:unnamed protein product [Pleuronectes platessa]